MRIVVVANLQLSPSVAYIMQHATVTYTVHVMKQSQAFGKGYQFCSSFCVQSMCFLASMSEDNCLLLLT